MIEDFSAPLWISMFALLFGLVGGAIGCHFMWDLLEIRRCMRKIQGNTREETLHNIRAQIETMRREYESKPADRFTHELFAMFDSLEKTLDLVEGEDFAEVRVG